MRTEVIWRKYDKNDNDGSIQTLPSCGSGGDLHFTSSAPEASEAPAALKARRFLPFASFPGSPEGNALVSVNGAKK